MTDLPDIRCVRLGTRNLGSADRLARAVIGLQGVREEQGACCYRSDSPDQTLVYGEGDPADHTVGFELRCADALDAAAAQIRDAGIAVRHASAAQCEQRRAPDEEARDQPRQIARANEACCMWGSVPDIAEFRRSSAGAAPSNPTS